MNHNDSNANTNPSNVLNGNTTGEKDMIDKHTIMSTSTDISNNSRIHAQAISVTPVQAQAANHRHGRGHETTTITPVLVSGQQWDYQTFADKTLNDDTEIT